MSQQELLSRVVRALDGAGVEYMVTGSLASSLQGEPRSTHDIDLVVAMTHAALPDLLEAFPPPDFYIDEAAARAAIDEKHMFNLVSIAEGDKVDFWMVTEEPFDESRFSRKRTEEVLGLALAVPSPEDTILAKLQWSKETGGSEKHFIDALRVYEVQGSILDHQYLDEWAARLDVADPWRRIKEQAELL